MLVLRNSYKCRWTGPERLGCTETTISQLLADSDQNPIHKWQVGYAMARELSTSIVQLHLVAGFQSEPDSSVFVQPAHYFIINQVHWCLSHTVYVSQTQSHKAMS